MRSFHSPNSSCREIPLLQNHVEKSDALPEWLDIIYSSVSSLHDESSPVLLIHIPTSAGHHMNVLINYYSCTASICQFSFTSIWHHSLHRKRTTWVCVQIQNACRSLYLSQQSSVVSWDNNQSHWLSFWLSFQPCYKWTSAAVILSFNHAIPVFPILHFFPQMPLPVRCLRQALLWPRPFSPSHCFAAWISCFLVLASVPQL